MSILTFEYDNVYLPAMPIVEFSIENYKGELSLDLVGLVDSGSDSTMIPVKYLKKIGARRAKNRNMKGVSGYSYTVDTYKAWIQLGEYRAYVNVIADKQNGQAIVGRDVLNDLVVTLNGLAHMTEIKL